MAVQRLAKVALVVALLGLVTLIIPILTGVGGGRQSVMSSTADILSAPEPAAERPTPRRVSSTRPSVDSLLVRAIQRRLSDVYIKEESKRQWLAAYREEIEFVGGRADPRLRPEQVVVIGEAVDENAVQGLGLRSDQIHKLRAALLEDLSRFVSSERRRCYFEVRQLIKRLNPAERQRVLAMLRAERAQAEGRAS